MIRNMRSIREDELHRNQIWTVNFLPKRPSRSQVVARHTTRRAWVTWSVSRDRKAADYAAVQSTHLSSSL